MLFERLIYLARKYLTAPRSCMFCGDENILNHAPFCKECFARYTKLLFEPCTDCGSHRLDCRCFTVNGCSMLCRLFNYKDKAVRRLIYKLKFSGRKSEFRFLAARLAEAICTKTGGVFSFDCVCFVPRSAQGKRIHGYDHAEEMALPLAEFLGLPCLPLLVHTGEKGEQKRLARATRAVAAKQKFKINTAFTENGKLPYKKIILVDDVLTTGATMSACATQLKDHGAVVICGAFIAHTPSKKTRQNQGGADVGT